MNKPQPQPNMNPDEVAASLAFATKLSEGLLGGTPQSSQTPQNQPGSMQTPEVAQPSTPDNSDAKFKEMEGKMDQMKAEMEAMMQKEISSIKDIIIEALKEDKQEDGQKD